MRGAIILSAIIVVISGTVGWADYEAWAPVEGRIQTQWASQVDPDHVLPDYPRPMMTRSNWQNLNGLWEYAIQPANITDKPQIYTGQILVPFAIESALSGVGKTVGADKCLWYRTRFTLARRSAGKRVLVHFGAVDWQCTVWMNGHMVGSHRGGYDPFYLDITDTVIEDAEQEMVVQVWDPTNHNNAAQPRGKQVENPGGIFYTSVTGIWQTVWVEVVPQAYIGSLKIVPDIDQQIVSVEATVVNASDGMTIRATAKEGWYIKAKEDMPLGQAVVLSIKRPKCWSPKRPYLYNLTVDLRSADGKRVDQVKSYFGMRKIAVVEDEQGVNRLFLNNEPLFQLGPLDQGWWPDGLYTAPTDEALRYDLEVTKKLGFNMLRKHVKLEPQRLYYWCDKMGLLVWQDMPSSLYKRDQVKASEREGIDEQWETEWKRIMDACYNHPSIVMWVPFNEGWGQYDTVRITQWTKQYDPSRLVNNASGWTDHQVGDVMDIHRYPGPDMPLLERHRAAVLGGFGGLGLPVEDHVWKDQGNWGYRSFSEIGLFEEKYVDLIVQLYELAEKGLAAAVYTQTTDCEIETNGLMTYDRDVIKLDPAAFRNLNKGYTPPQFMDARTSFLGTLSLELSARNPRAKIRYTLDGKEPTRFSQLYNGPIRLTHDATVKARAYWPRGEKSLVVSKSFRKETVFVSAEDPNITKEGLVCELFQGHWTALPDFSEKRPMQRTVCDKMDLTHFAQLEKDFGLRFTGFIRVPKTDVYRFYTQSDDGTVLTVAGSNVVVNDGVHGMTEASGEIALEAGWHPIELAYFQGVGGLGLRVSYEGPAISKQLIPGIVLGHE